MSPQDLEAQQKQELEERQEKTDVGRYYVPYTDIFESSDALFVTMDIPGVGKDSVDVSLEKNVLTITGKVDLAKYNDLEPLYTEYNVGHYTRSFTVSEEIDKDGISAKVVDGVLAVRLPKIKEVAARRIKIE